jgi:hypothetical protein
MSTVPRSTEPSARWTNARAVSARASQTVSSARWRIVTAGRSASSASWCRPKVHRASARRIRTRPASTPLACRTALSKAASPERVRPANTSARPSVASTSASRCGEPASRARRTAVRSSRMATTTSPNSRRTMPTVWCATEASCGSGLAASTARARASASFGRDSASGSSSSVAPGSCTIWRLSTAIRLMLDRGILPVPRQSFERGSHGTRAEAASTTGHKDRRPGEADQGRVQPRGPPDHDRGRPLHGGGQGG